ncbi:single-stranded DNA-binding protein [Thiohalomonas denitrificans]|uniref:Stage III sporulation protein SpoIIIAA n=1 Tax=Thiohalomonas denitrificans TaxID=415747 RepID=A0A1G5QRY7_9GAMM|nr:single-stranded DNA-binding protein [Thiohalomonas denitrificans]SCZ64348.1 Stage III sporulation protein SpoIIIAA [Thiohalomonas denitrificans]
MKQTITDDLRLLTATLPGPLRAAVEALPADQLLEIILDLGRTPQARLARGAVELSDRPISRELLTEVVSGLGDFGADNRAGIEGTLHRISALRNRRGEIVGLTLRVGRAMQGTIDLIREYVEGGKSLLLLGRPGVGKTTKLREIARVLADEFDRRVVVVDTSNEIAGDGDVPHPAIGRARRMQVPHPNRQHAVMIEAVENHMPEAIIVDEIGTAEETLAARTIAERGVQLIATAHGNSLDNLVRNPTLADLVGGVQTVTLSDEEARFRRSRKSVNERKSSPTFEVVIELTDRETFTVHPDSATAVDQLLMGRAPHGVRFGTIAGDSETPRPAPAVVPECRQPQPMEEPAHPLRIHAHALSRDSVERVIRDMRLDARTVRSPEQADLILTLRSRAADPSILNLVATTGIPLRQVKKNTTAQIRRLLQTTLRENEEWEERFAS